MFGPYAFFFFFLTLFCVRDSCVRGYKTKTKTSLIPDRKVYNYLISTHTLPQAIPTLEIVHLPLPKPRRDTSKTNIVFSGAVLWKHLTLTVTSCHTLSSFERTRDHREAVT